MAREKTGSERGVGSEREKADKSEFTNLLLINTEPGNTLN